MKSQLLSISRLRILCEVSFLIFNHITYQYIQKTELLAMLTGLSFILYIYMLCVIRRAAYPKLIQFNARNIYKIRIVQMLYVLQWSHAAILQQESPSHQGIEKMDCSIEESERELVVPLIIGSWISLAVSQVEAQCVSELWISIRDMQGQVVTNSLC